MLALRCYNWDYYRHQLNWMELNWVLLYECRHTHTITYNYESKQTTKISLSFIYLLPIAYFFFFWGFKNSQGFMCVLADWNVFFNTTLVSQCHCGAKIPAALSSALPAIHCRLGTFLLCYNFYCVSTLPVFCGLPLQDLPFIHFNNWWRLLKTFTTLK